MPVSNYNPKYYSVAKLCPALWDPTDCSMPGFSVLHCLRVCSNSCPLSQWCYLTISSSAAPFSFCLQSFPASRSFPMSWLFVSGVQSMGASVSVFPMNIQDRLPLGLTDLISLQSKRLLKSLLQLHSSKASILWCSAFLMAQFSHLVYDYWKNHSSDYIQTIVGKVMSLIHCLGLS